MCLLLLMKYENLECRRLNCLLLTPLLPGHANIPGKSSTWAVLVVLSLKSFWLHTLSTISSFPLVSPSLPLPQYPKIWPDIEHLSDSPQRQFEIQISHWGWFLMPPCQATYSLGPFVRTACTEIL